MGCKETHTKKLDQTFALREPAVRSAIRNPQIAPNSDGLDVGCVAGKITQLLAESTPPRGRVSGVVFSPDRVAHARAGAEKAGLSGIAPFIEGKEPDMLFLRAMAGFSTKVCKHQCPIHCEHCSRPTQ